MKLRLFEISETDWENPAFSTVVLQAKDSARKISKGIDVGLERKRFTNASSRIEQIAIKVGKEITFENKTIKETDLSLSEGQQICYPFVELKKNTNTSGAVAIVFILDEYIIGTITVKKNSDELVNRKKRESNVPHLNKIDTAGIDEIKSRFHNQILSAIKKGNPIGWISISDEDNSSQNLIRHEGLITCIREHIYVSKPPVKQEPYKEKEKVIDKEANEKRMRSFWFRLLNSIFKQPLITKIIDVERTKIVKLNIIPHFIQFAFNDGSVSAEFPLYCLENSEPPKLLPVFRVALISNRHFELDEIVEGCLLRNSEISRRQEATIAEQEKLSFEIASKYFEEILTAGGCHLELYHTGLEPAVLGTYRAFLTLIQKKENRGKLMITPKVYKGNNKFQDLKQWY